MIDFADKNAIGAINFLDELVEQGDLLEEVSSTNIDHIKMKLYELNLHVKERRFLKNYILFIIYKAQFKTILKEFEEDKDQTISHIESEVLDVLPLLIETLNQIINSQFKLKAKTFEQSVILLKVTFFVHEEQLQLLEIFILNNYIQEQNTVKEQHFLEEFNQMLDRFIEAIQVSGANFPFAELSKEKFLLKQILSIYQNSSLNKEQQTHQVNLLSLKLIKLFPGQLSVLLHKLVNHHNYKKLMEYNMKHDKMDTIMEESLNQTEDSQRDTIKNLFSESFARD